MYVRGLEFGSVLKPFNPAKFVVKMALSSEMTLSVYQTRYFRPCLK